MSLECIYHAEKASEDDVRCCRSRGEVEGGGKGDKQTREETGGLQSGFLVEVRGHRGDADRLLAPVKLGVVRANDRVANDDKRASGGGDVNASKAEQALGLDGKDVLGAGQGDRRASKVK